MRQKTTEKGQGYHMHSNGDTATSGTFPCERTSKYEAIPSTTISNLTSNTHLVRKIVVEEPRVRTLRYKSLKEEVKIAIKRHEETLKELAKQ